MRDDAVTVSEASAVLGVDHEMAALIMAGPLAPCGGRLTLRQVLACRIVANLAMLTAHDAISIALGASADAQTEGTARLLAVGWRKGGPAACWLAGDLPAKTTAALLILPPDRWLAELTERIAEHRAAAARPN